MPTINKVMLLGRLTRDPEVRTFASGGRVASFGLAINSKRRNQATGQYENSATFVDVEAFAKTAEFAAQYLHKGSAVFLEGHLKMDQWQDRTTGQSRSKLKVVADSIQFMEPRQGGQDRPAGESSSRPSPRQPEQPAQRAPAPPANAMDDTPLPPSGMDDEPPPF